MLSVETGVCHSMLLLLVRYGLHCPISFCLCRLPAFLLLCYQGMSVVCGNGVGSGLMWDTEACETLHYGCFRACLCMQSIDSI